MPLTCARVIKGSILSGSHSACGVEFCRLASAWIKLASPQDVGSLTMSFLDAPRHTCPRRRRCRNRSLCPEPSVAVRRERGVVRDPIGQIKTQTSGQARLRSTSRTPPLGPDAHSCTPTSSIRIISSGSTEGRPVELVRTEPIKLAHVRTDQRTYQYERRR